MRLAVSNIAWNLEEDPLVFKLLAELGVSGVEIAPTKIWPEWRGITSSAIKIVKHRIAEMGFDIPALQAILFGRPDLQLFGGSATVSALVEHISRVADLAAQLGARTLVFGSPRNRDPGDMTAVDARNHTVDVFRRMGESCAAQGVALGLEANPPQYACTFMNRWSDAAEIVRLVDHSGVRIHLDAACISMVGDDPGDAVRQTIDILTHVHISEPNLGGFETPTVDHGKFGRALGAAGYRAWASIEMRRHDSPIPAIRRAIKVAQTEYPCAVAP